MDQQDEARPGLAERIQRARDKGLSYKDLEQRSGGVIKAQTFNAIVMGKHGLRFHDTRAAVAALAQALGEPERVINEDLNLPTTAQIAWPERFNQLSQRQRRLVFALADELLNSASSDQGRDAD